MDKGILRALRNELTHTVHEFIDKVQMKQDEITVVVKLKKATYGFLCIITVKKVMPDKEKTISKSGLKVSTMSDLMTLKMFLKCLEKFINDICCK